jgi:hypothetical protein
MPFMPCQDTLQFQSSQGYVTCKQQSVFFHSNESFD